MAIWKDVNPTKQKETTAGSRDPAAKEPAKEEVAKESKPEAGDARDREVSGRAKERESTESLISADLTIEGKIEGAGHVRLVGKFKGDVQVKGDFTIEPGAKVTGSVRAGTVIIGGELEGNIDAASNVELLETGVMNGDLKARSLTVAAGSRMRGQVEFGWEEEELRAKEMKTQVGSRNE